MSFEIGPLPPVQPGDVAVISLPPSPPPEVRDAVAEARDRAAEVAGADQQPHFLQGDENGHMVIQVRDLAGNVVRTIPPSEALAVMSGAPV